MLRIEGKFSDTTVGESSYSALWFRMQTCLILSWIVRIEVYSGIKVRCLALNRVSRQLLVALNIFASSSLAELLKLFRHGWVHNLIQGY